MKNTLKNNYYHTPKLKVFVYVVTSTFKANDRKQLFDN
jgi:hypothetical protein